MAEGTEVATVGGGSEVVSATQAGALLERALDRGAEISAIEKLADLMWRQEERNAARALNQAITDLQHRVGSVAKRQKAEITTKGGGRYGYTYASLDDIRRAIAPYMSELGLSYTWDSRLDGSLLHCECKVSHLDGGVRVATFECPVDTSAAMSGAQKAGAALTYAKRQSLVSALGLTMADEDTDAAVGESKSITDEQAATIKGLLKEADRNVAGFLAWLGCDSVEDMPAYRFDEVRKMLEGHVAKAKAEAA